jgi:hypothetical protein
LLKEGWLKLPETEKDVFREWTEWDKKRYSRDLAMYENLRARNDDDAGAEMDDMKTVHVPKKRKHLNGGDLSPTPRKKKP